MQQKLTAKMISNESISNSFGDNTSNMDFFVNVVRESKVRILNEEDVRTLWAALKRKIKSSKSLQITRSARNMSLPFDYAGATKKLLAPTSETPVPEVPVPEVPVSPASETPVPPALVPEVTATTITLKIGGVTVPVSYSNNEVLHSRLAELAIEHFGGIMSLKLYNAAGQVVEAADISNGDTITVRKHVKGGSEAEGSDEEVAYLFK